MFIILHFKVYYITVTFHLFELLTQHKASCARDNKKKQEGIKNKLSLSPKSLEESSEFLSVSNMFSTDFMKQQVIKPKGLNFIYSKVLHYYFLILYI